MVSSRNLDISWLVSENLRSVAIWKSTRSLPNASTFRLVAAKPSLTSDSSDLTPASSDLTSDSSDLTVAMSALTSDSSDLTVWTTSRNSIIMLSIFSSSLS